MRCRRCRMAVTERGGCGNMRKSRHCRSINRIKLYDVVRCSSRDEPTRDQSHPPAHALSSYDPIPQTGHEFRSARYRSAPVVNGQFSAVPRIPGLHPSVRNATRSCRGCILWITSPFVEENRHQVVCCNREHEHCKNLLFPSFHSMTVWE